MAQHIPTVALVGTLDTKGRPYSFRHCDHFDVVDTLPAGNGSCHAGNVLAGRIDVVSLLIILTNI